MIVCAYPNRHHGVRLATTYPLLCKLQAVFSMLVPDRRVNQLATREGSQQHLAEQSARRSLYSVSAAGRASIRVTPTTLLFTTCLEMVGYEKSLLVRNVLLEIGSWRSDMRAEPLTWRSRLNQRRGFPGIEVGLHSPNERIKRVHADY